MSHSGLGPNNSHEVCDQNCIFVAKYQPYRTHLQLSSSLPQKMTNEQLALALINAFRHFGPIVSVKASRDARGRPFGFVEFSHPACAQEALAAAPFININFRQVRVEQAKCQRKLGVRMRIPARSTEEGVISVQLKSMRELMLEYVEEAGLKLNIFKAQSPEDPRQLDTVISAVLKFNDSRAADHAYQALVKESIDWSLEWLPSDRDGHNSGIRSSGLVHIIPSALGPSAYYSVPLYMPPSALELFSQPSPSIMQAITTGHRLHGLQCEERLMESDECELAKEFEELSVNSDGVEKDRTMRILGSTVFVGRLNSQKITLDSLIDHFSQHGPIRYACLFNRGAITFEGVPIDSYAFITFVDKLAAKACIESSNGSVWLGQTMKCEAARMLPSTPTVIQLYHQDNP